MGIWDFFRIKKKNAGRKSESLEVKEVKINEIEKFLESHYSRISRDVLSEIEDLKLRIAWEIDNLKNNIIKLEEAKIKNENIMGRAISIMEGNRRTYIQKINVFVSKIDMPSDVKEMVKFCTEFDKSIDELTKTTVKSHSFMQEFFLKETNAISNSVVNLDELIVKIKKIISSSKLEKFEGITKEISELNKKLKQKENLEKEIELKEGFLEKQKGKLEKLNGDLNRLEVSEEYEKFIGSLDDRDKLLREIVDLKAELLHYFSAIEPALRKYERLNPDDKMVRGYLEDHFKALLNDKDLEIRKIISEVRKEIINGKIDLRDDKKQRILHEIEKIGRDYFDKAIGRHNGLDRGLKELNKEIENSEVDKKIKEVKKEISREKNEIEDGEKQHERVKRELKEIEIEALKENIEGKVKEFCGERIEIKI